MIVPRIAALLLAALSACNGDPDENVVTGPATPAPGRGSLTLLATDAPFLYEHVSAARITVDRVLLHADPAAEDGGFVPVGAGFPRTIDLYGLRNGRTAELAQSDLRPSTYRQIRVHVSSAQLVLANGNTYSTAEGNLRMATQPANGFVIHMDPPLEIVDQIASTRLLDFDLTHSFRPVPSDDPLHADAYEFEPVIRLSDPRSSGTIRGDVVRPGAPQPTPVVNATVYFLPVGVTDVDQSIAITATTTTGTYAQLGLPPGLYDLRAVKGALVGTASAVEVTAGGTTVGASGFHDEVGDPRGAVDLAGGELRVRGRGGAAAARARVVRDRTAPRDRRTHAFLA